MAPSALPVGPGRAVKWLKNWKWILAAAGVVALAVISGGGSGGGDDDGADGSGCKVEVTVADLNVRDGPSTDHTVVDQLVEGDVVDAERETADGFHKLGDDRWVSSEFVEPSDKCAADDESGDESGEAEPTEDG